MDREVSPAHLELLRLVASIEASQAPAAQAPVAEPRPPADKAWFKRNWRMLEDVGLAPDAFTRDEKYALEAERAQTVKRKPRRSTRRI